VEGIHVRINNGGENEAESCELTSLMCQGAQQNDLKKQTTSPPTFEISSPLRPFPLFSPRQTHYLYHDEIISLSFESCNALCTELKEPVLRAVERAGRKRMWGIFSPQFFHHSLFYLLKNDEDNLCSCRTLCSCLCSGTTDVHLPVRQLLQRLFRAMSASF